MGAQREEGWGYLDTFTGGTRKAHFYEDTGQSLCGRWLALGEPRWLLTQLPTVRSPKAHCAVCWKKYWATHQNAAEGAMIAEHGVPS